MHKQQKKYQANQEGKETYVVFINTEETYDKVWSNVIFYLLWGWRIKGKLWRTMYKCNQNLKRTIATKFGQTDAINIEDSMQQGRHNQDPNLRSW